MKRKCDISPGVDIEFRFFPYSFHLADLHKMQRVVVFVRTQFHHPYVLKIIFARLAVDIGQPANPILYGHRTSRQWPTDSHDRFCQQSASSFPNVQITCLSE